MAASLRVSLLGGAPVNRLDKVVFAQVHRHEVALGRAAGHVDEVLRQLVAERVDVEGRVQGAGQVAIGRRAADIKHDVYLSFVRLVLAADEFDGERLALHHEILLRVRISIDVHEKRRVAQAGHVNNK